MNYDILCNYIYNAFQIPVYRYQNQELLASHPTVESYLLPPQEYLHAMWTPLQSYRYCITNFYAYYGCVTKPETGESFIIGPVSYLPYSNELLHKMHQEFHVPNDQRDTFNSFLCSIVPMNAEHFFQVLDFIHYLITGNVSTSRGFPTLSDTSIEKEINTQYFADSYIFNDNGITNNSMELERRIFPCIERGDVSALQEALVQSTNPNLGIIAKNNLRQQKNAFIVSITLASRAAIKGGLAPALAYKLSDTYIQQMESLTNIDTIGQLSFYAMVDFAKRTHESGSVVINSSRDMTIIIEYVQTHLNEHITVESIAASFGYNRSYLSRKFKQELGFDLSAFIKRCKLETSKALLTYSDRSLCDISEYLCFSSQSYYQKSFKKQFGLTPMQYRNQTK